MVQVRVSTVREMTVRESTGGKSTGGKSTVRESTIQVDGISVYFAKAGAGPAMVLVHGLVGSSQNWDKNMLELAKHRTVYALDLVNMGESERVASVDAGLEATADRVARCMDELGIARADVAGHSHGGAIAMMLAARHPERVDRLVLFAPANPYCEHGLNATRFYSSRFGTWLARRVPGMPRLLHGWAYRRMHGNPATAEASALDGYTRKLNGESVEHVLRIVRAWKEDMAVLRTRLAELAGRPVLLIWGDLDRAVGLGSGERLARRLGAKMLVLPGVGHLPFAEAAELSNRAMVDWLGR